MGPTVLVTFVSSLFLLKFFFANEFKTGFDVKDLNEFKHAYGVKNKNLLKKSVIILAGVIFLFTIQGYIGIEVSLIAVGGAALLLVITRISVDKILHEVDWSTLLFFTGLFIVIGVLKDAGGIEVLSSAVIDITGGSPWPTFLSTIWLSAIASGFVDNIPFTITMVPLIETLTKDPNIVSAFAHLTVNPLWWALTLGADFGGNLTLIGSSAGVVAAGISAKFGYHLSFNKWIKIGLPFTIVTVVIGTLCLSIFTLLL